MKTKSKEQKAIKAVKQFLKEQKIQYKFKSRNKLLLNFEATDEPKERAKRILCGVMNINRRIMSA